MLMRAGGVPAHVVTGYLGGSWNRFGGYLLIKQSQAHAWTEVWLDDIGWLRVDPTAVIDSEEFRAEDDEALAEVGTSGSGSRIGRWFVATVQAFQAMDAWWQDEFVNFNTSKQFRLLGWLGLKDRDYETLVALLAIGGAAWLSFLAWRGRGLADPKPRDALSRSWRRLERALRRKASARAPHEGPVSYGERVAGERPELAATLRLLTREYARLRYGRDCSAAQQLRFERAVRLFTAWTPR
jgi:hypothetical protein